MFITLNKYFRIFKLNYVSLVCFTLKFQILVSFPLKFHVRFMKQVSFFPSLVLGLPDLSAYQRWKKKKKKIPSSYYKKKKKNQQNL